MHRPSLVALPALIAGLLATAVALLAAGTTSAATIAEKAAAQPEPVLSVYGKNLDLPPGPDGIQVTWDTGTGALAKLTRSVDGGKPVQFGLFDPRATVGIPPVPDSARQVFQLSQVGRTPKDLVTVVVQGGKATVVKTERPVPPRDTPPWVDQLLQITPVLILALFAVLTALYVRSLRGLRHA